jgi:hypothetical protein
LIQQINGKLERKAKEKEDFNVKIDKEISDLKLDLDGEKNKI